MKRVSDIISDVSKVVPIDEMADNKDNGVLTKFQGEEVKVVGFAIATKGNGCQQVAWFKSKDFIEED